jgi:hypothetical protein
MSDPYRLELTIRTILVTWRGAMRQISAGYIADRAESAARATSYAQRMLAAVANRADPSDARLAQLLLAATAEVHGAWADDRPERRQHAG